MLKNFFTPKNLAIDFGTANCIIIEKGKGIVLREPTVVAISPKEKRVIAVGRDAQIMLGRVPEGIEARRPLKNGGISNYRLAEALLRKFFDRILGHIRLVRPAVIVSVPANINSVEERAIIQAFRTVRAGQIYLFPEPVAAAVGAQMPIHSSSGNFIANLGAGTAEIAVLSLNGVVAVESHRGSGDAINQEIIDYIKSAHSIIIGEVTAEMLKMQIGHATEPEIEETLIVSGKNSKTGLPESIEITSSELIKPIRLVLDIIAESIQRVLAKTPPELISDIIDRGIVLSGGTAMLKNIDKYISNKINITAHVVDDPLSCVAKGLSVVLDNLDDYRRNVKSG